MASTKEFFGTILESGLARTNRFEVTIPIPSGSSGSADDGGGDFLSDLTGGTFNVSEAVGVVKDVIGASSPSATRSLGLMTESSSMPGKTMVTSEVRYNGDMQSIPYASTYGDLSFVFRVSGDMKEKVILDEWAKRIYDPVKHEIKYMDDYVTDITIDQLDVQDNIIYTVILKDAYPTLTNELPVSNEDTNQVHKLSVTFAYRRWITPDMSNNNTDGIGALSQTPLGPYVNDVLNNPAIEKGLEVLERKTGVDLEGEAVNIYNQVDEIVKGTTGESINKSVSMIGEIKAATEMNGKISDLQKSKVLDIIDDTITNLGS